MTQKHSVPIKICVSDSLPCLHTEAKSQHTHLSYALFEPAVFYSPVLAQFASGENGNC